LRNWHLLSWSRNNSSFVWNPKVDGCVHMSTLLKPLPTQINLAHKLHYILLRSSVMKGMLLATTPPVFRLLLLGLLGLLFGYEDGGEIFLRNITLYNTVLTFVATTVTTADSFMITLSFHLCLGLLSCSFRSSFQLKYCTCSSPF
jgi:hypothetical protein